MSDLLVTERTKKHFNDIAPNLDWWARRNRYYYQDLDRLHHLILGLSASSLVTLQS